jgi:hypothetical protein
MSTKHTPGKWTASKQFVNCGDKCIAKCVGRDVVNDEWVASGEAIANAQFIASAPALLEQLQTLVNLHEGVADGGEGIKAEDWQTTKDIIASVTLT